GEWLAQTNLPDPADHFDPPKPDTSNPNKNKPDSTGLIKPEQQPDPATILQKDKQQGKPDPGKPDPGGIFKPEKPDLGGKKPPSDEPSLTTEIYGKTIDEWIALIPSKDPSRSQAAILNLLHFGPKLAQRAAPALTKLMSKPWELDLSVRVNAIVV